MRRRRLNPSKNTFTKVMVKIILAVAIIDLQFTYVLAFMGKTDTLEETSGKLITEIIGVVLVYCIKSFFETREQEKIRIEEEKLSCLDMYGDINKDFSTNSFDNN